MKVGLGHVLGLVLLLVFTPPHSLLLSFHMSSKGLERELLAQKRFSEQREGRTGLLALSISLTLDSRQPTVDVLGLLPSFLTLGWAPGLYLPSVWGLLQGILLSSPRPGREQELGSEGARGSKSWAQREQRKELDLETC